jgi:hypothetical protein
VYGDEEKYFGKVPGKRPLEPVVYRADDTMSIVRTTMRPVQSSTRPGSVRRAERWPRRYSGLHLLRAQPFADRNSPARRVYSPELALRRSAGQSVIRCRVGSDTPDRLPRAKFSPKAFSKGNKMTAVTADWVVDGQDYYIEIADNVQLSVASTCQLVALQEVL